MEIIDNIELKEENIYPDENVLSAVLGKSYNAYCRLLKIYDENGLGHEWRYYKDGKAWLCKVQRKNKTIAWMSAWKGYMKATIYVPEEDVEEIYSLKIDEEIKNRIRNTKNVGKSKPCTFENRNKKILGDFEEVMKYKILKK